MHIYMWKIKEMSIWMNILQHLVVAFFPIYSRIALIGGSVVIWVYMVQYTTGFILSIVYNFTFDIGVPALLTAFWETFIGSIFTRYHSEFGNLVFFVFFIHIFLKVYARASNSEVDHTWLTGIFIAILTYVAGITGAIMPCSILSEVTATIVGYSMNSIILIAFDCVETLLIPGLGLTDDTMTRVFVVHFIAPTLVLLIVADHVGNLHLTEYYDEDEIDVIYLFRREYMLEFFAIESFFWFEYFMFFLTLRMVVDFFWPEYMTISYTLSNLEFWPVLENINYVIAIPHWYLRPLMSSLVTIPHHYLGFIYVILLFLAVLFQPWYDDVSKANFPYLVTLNVYSKLAVESILYLKYFFFYLCAALVYICAIVPTGRYFIPLGSNEEIVQVFWFFLFYFLSISKIPNVLNNLTFSSMKFTENMIRWD